MVFVVAGSYQEFRDYANHQRKYNPKELTYLTSEEQLDGVKNPKFILTGKFYDAPIIKSEVFTKFWNTNR